MRSRVTTTKATVAGTMKTNFQKFHNRESLSGFSS